MATEDRSRKRFQRTASGAPFTEIVHPLDRSKRFRLKADTDEELITRLSKVRSVAWDFDHGFIPRQRAELHLSNLRRGSPLSIEEAWRRWSDTLDRMMFDKARSVWRHRLEPFLGGKTCYDCDERQMRIWIRDLEREGYASKTISTTYWLLHAAMKLAVRSHLIDSIPWGDWHAPAGEVETPRAHARSMEELVAIVNVAFARDAEAWATSDRLGDLAFRILTFFYVGLRNGEGGALGWDHWHPAEGVLEVRLQARDGWRTAHPEWSRPREPTKGRKQHAVRVHPVVHQVLEWQRSQLQRLGIWREDGPIFPKDEGGEWRTNNACIKPRTFKQIVRAAGVANVARWSPHSLRHCKATLEGLAGGQPSEVQVMLGHSNEKTTLLYMHIAPTMPVSRLPSMALPEALRAQVTNAARKALEEADTEPPPADDILISRNQDDDAGEIVGMYELARQAIAEGGMRACPPKTVRDAANRAYVKAYNRAQRAGKDDAIQRCEGRAARKRYIGTWNAALARVAKERT